LKVSSSINAMNDVTLFNNIGELVPHQAPMLLIDSVICWDDTGIDVLVKPEDSYLFADDQGAIPAYVGIEYMAQTISAFAGIEAKQNKEPICLGFLLGTRQYEAEVTHFLPSQPLIVKVRQLLRDDTNLVLFDCAIYHAGNQLAKAEIKAIQPKDINEIVAHFKTMNGTREEPHE
jgi:predicted hotdog family 3-hydroxylacyl-ACP dehydratase